MNVIVKANVLGKDYRILVSYTETDYDGEYMFHDAQVVDGSCNHDASFLLDNENFLADTVDCIDDFN